MRAWIVRQDHRIVKKLDRALPRWLLLWAHALTRSGDGGLWYGVGLFVGVFGGSKRWLALLAAALSISLGIVFFLMIKRLARRPRPARSEHRHRLNIDRYSFPSGHTVTAFALAESFSRFYPSQEWLFLIAGLIGASRVVLCRHYLSDVLIGALLGWQTGRLSVYLVERL